MTKFLPPCPNCGWHSMAGEGPHDCEEVKARAAKTSTIEAKKKKGTKKKKTS